MNALGMRHVAEGGAPRRCASRARVDRLRLRRRRHRAVPRVGRHQPAVGLRTLEARPASARSAPDATHRAHGVAVRRARQQLRPHHAAACRRARHMGRRQRPARLPHLHARPGAGHPAPRRGPPPGHVPPHQPGRDHVVRPRRGKCSGSPATTPTGSRRSPPPTTRAPAPRPANPCSTTPRGAPRDSPCSPTTMNLSSAS